ncbi:MAG: AAA family ATPase [Clostridiales bacterium]|nr:AAA family ATPase [Clostridiales bacterium]
MAIPQIKEEDIIKALAYIDENGVPVQHMSTKYELVTDDGHKYPPKYVIAVANHLANGTEISTDGYNAVEAKNYLQTRGYNITTNQVKFELTITADDIVSTDPRFTMDNLTDGDNYKPIDTYFKAADGTIIRREYIKGERRNSNQTMPRIACQIYETQLDALTVTEKENFPICRYNLGGYLYSGIYPSIADFKKYRKTIEYLVYNCRNGKQFVLYCWNVFSTILFVQECLKEFGSKDDQFVLIYREKDEKETKETEEEEIVKEELVQQFQGYRNFYSRLLIESKNIIFRGAPGTGKSYLAKEIAADIISDGYFDEYKLLNDEQKQQVEFVQFHPSYDYTDFVEGLRPKINYDGSIGFELQDGIFKRFVDRARKNYENSLKTIETIEKELSVREAIDEFFSNIKFGIDTFKTIRGSEFSITDVDDDRIYVAIPGNAKANNLILDIDKLSRMLEADFELELKDIKELFGHARRMQDHSYYLAIYKEIKALKTKKKTLSTQVKKEELKKYIFIIDEINRGEISKIFGELFFTIDPGYRGENGAVKTQYANLHADPEEKFYIPDNVYIIGTMNDIDRSVDSFDFAMRRRFRFIELKADARLEMLDNLGDEDLKNEAIKRMTSLNNAIAAVEDLNENYQIGASYFLKLKTLSIDQLWEDYLKPLLQEYIRGMHDEKGIMSKLEQAYFKPDDGDANDNT